MKEPDSFVTRVKSKMPFNYSIKLKNLQNCTLAIKIDLRAI